MRRPAAASPPMRVLQARHAPHLPPHHHCPYHYRQHHNQPPQQQQPEVGAECVGVVAPVPAVGWPGAAAPAA